MNNLQFISKDCPISPTLRTFIKGYFDDAGVDGCSILEIEEFANTVKKKDVRDELQMIRAKCGNLWLSADSEWATLVIEETT